MFRFASALCFTVAMANAKADLADDLANKVLKLVKSKKMNKVAPAKKVNKAALTKKISKVYKKSNMADDGYVCKGTHCWSGVEILCHGDECTD